ncbi:MAG: thermosome subunit beta [Nitrososphaerales archaeon]
MAVIPATTASGQPVLLLKEAATETKGRAAQKNNIMAAKVIAELVKSSLGPKGMDKMIVDSIGDVTITNDGATMLKQIDVQHPAAKMMVELAKATDNEVGDGTTSVVVLAGALLERAEELIDKDIHPIIIVDGYRNASEKALEILKDIAIRIDPDDKGWLKKVATTPMASKLVAEESDYLAELVVDALLQVREKVGEQYKVEIDYVKVEKKPGGSLRDTMLIKGVALDKEVVHSGMPKRIEKAKIALLNTPLEIEKTEFSAEIRINDPLQIKRFMDEETKILKEMVDKIVNTGANVVICQKGIDDIAQHFLAKKGILAVRRVKQSDMDKLARASGGRIVTNVDDLTPNDLGEAELVEERKVETDKWVFIEGCKNPKSVTLFIRGGSQRVVDEAERSVHDALMVVKDVIEKPYIVAGGGAPEAELAYKLREWSNTLSGREQLAAQRFADAIESIALTLATNAGLDPIDIGVELRSMHSKGNRWYGVNLFKGKVDDMEALGIYEPLVVKEQIIKGATEAASMILRIDDVVAAGKTKETPKPPTPPGGEEGGEKGGETPSD